MAEECHKWRTMRFLPIFSEKVKKHGKKLEIAAAIY